VVDDLQGSYKNEIQSDSGNLPFHYFDFDLGTAELLGFRGSCPGGASNRDCYSFQPAASPDGYSDSNPFAQLYPTYSDDHTISDGNCHSVTQPYAGSDSYANHSGNARDAA
jgi:hypothetical protein